MDEARVPGVHAVSPPVESRLCGLYPGAQLVDSYAIALPTSAPIDPERLARQVFGTFPAWVRALMWVRDRAVAPFGVKTSGQMRKSPTAAADRINFFRILERWPDELILGEDDKHLDFRASLLIRPQQNGNQLVVTTVVKCNNGLGKFYLAAILPFHVIIVRTSLRRCRAWDGA